MKPTSLELKQAAVTLARGCMAAFGSAIIDGYDPKPYQIKIANALQAVEEGKIKHLIITAPPQHMKSLHSSIIFPAYCLGRNPKRRVIESSFSGAIAARFGRQVRNVSQLPVTKLIFPSLELAEDSQAKNKFDTTEGGYYVAAGRDGSITSYGCDIMILDDLYANKQEADSEVIQENIWDTYLTVYKTRLHKDSAIIMLMTRWSDSDLIGRVLSLEGRDDEVKDSTTGEWRKATPEDEGLERGVWRVLNFPAIATEDEDYRKKGEALWPEKQPIEYLRAQEKLNPDVFSCMYQGDPVNEDNAEFKRSWFKPFQDHECPHNINIFMTVDPAIGKGQDNDETSIMVCGMAPDRSVYVIENVHGRFDPSETIEEIFRLADMYNPVQIGIESVAYQQALKHFLEKEMLVRYKNSKSGIYNVVAIQSRNSKEERIRGLIPYYKMGLIYHRVGHCADIEKQLLRFPKSVHDDIMDSLSMQVQLWTMPMYSKPKLNTGRKAKDIAKEDGVTR